MSVLAGLRAALPGQEIAYAEGVAIASDDESGIAQAAALCDGADTIILCLGESATMSGEAASRAYPGLPGKQLELARAVMARAKNKRIVSSPVFGPAAGGAGNRDSAGASHWRPGRPASEASNALADVLEVGKVSPSEAGTPVKLAARVGADSHFLQ